MTDRRDDGNDFHFKATIVPDEDPQEAEARWYRWNKEEKRWEFSGNEMPTCDELSERNKEHLRQGVRLHLQEVLQVGTQ